MSSQDTGQGKELPIPHGGGGRETQSSDGDGRAGGRQVGSQSERPDQPDGVELRPAAEEEDYSEVSTILTSWSGPLPHPATLQAFDEVVRGGAERIFRQFEIEAEHRRNLESYRASPDISQR
ncbi:MAG: DUF2335 domain-containing protein [Xanthobacteraceae bacterium]|nr:DUF2335 domain-containing protein [Xanthobacteraceae bacterium]